MPNSHFDPSSQSSSGFAPQGMASEVPHGLLDDEEGGLDIRRYVGAMLRHKWLILSLGAAGLALGALASRVVEPVYESAATIQIEILSSFSRQDSPIRTSRLMDTPQGWTELLRSFTVLDEVVRRRRLNVEPLDPVQSRYFETFDAAADLSPGNYSLTANAAGDRVTLAIRDGAVLEEKALGDSVGGKVGFRWAPSGLAPGERVEFSVASPRDAAMRLGAALQVPQLKPDDAFMRISIRGTDPVSITATVNAVAERFVEVSGLLKRDKLSGTTEMLRTQLDRSQAELLAVENALETFRVNTMTMPSDGGTAIASGLMETRSPVQQAFFRTRLERDSLTQEREAIDRALRVAPDSNTSLLILLGTIPSVRSSTELNAALDLLGSKRSEVREMRLAYGPSHEPLRKLDREITELETRTIPSQARALSANLERRVKDLEGRIASSSREMQQIPARISEEARLQRRVLVAANSNTSLLVAYESARLAEMGAGPDVRLLDEARVPTSPLADQVRVIILGGLAGGLGLGVLISLLLDRFDKRIRYPEQVTQDLGLTILGTLPMMKRSRAGVVDPEFSAQLLESMRGIRMNLSYAHGTAGTFITTITSPGPGDGKSFTSANLARAFAASGRRTILVDADTRRGLLHHTLGVERRPGLIDLLDGSAKRQDVIRTLDDWGIDFVPCGTRRTGGPELLSSPTMAQFILGLRSEYQAIIIDSPPLAAGVDPLVLASLTSSMVIVLRTGVTDRDMAHSRLGELNRLPIRLLGAILNDVKAEGLYKYYGYLPGYRAEDEVEEEPAVHTPPSPGTAKRLKGS